MWTNGNPAKIENGVTMLTSNLFFSKSWIVTESYKMSKSMRDHSKNA